MKALGGNGRRQHVVTTPRSCGIKARDVSLFLSHSASFIESAMGYGSLVNGSERSSVVKRFNAFLIIVQCNFTCHVKCELSCSM